MYPYLSYDAIKMLCYSTHYTDTASKQELLQPATQFLLAQLNCQKKISQHKGKISLKLMEPEQLKLP
jgi:hypothetical protein